MKKEMINSINNAIETEKRVVITMETDGHNCSTFSCLPDAIDVEDGYLVIYSGHDICVVGTKQVEQVSENEFDCIEEHSRITISA